MAYILTSFLHTHYKDENGVRFAIPIENTNKILTNIKRYLKGHEKIVVVANNKTDFFDNELRAKAAFDGFIKSGIEFKQELLLDERNKDKAAQILEGADLIILSGGKCNRQLKFLNEINFGEFLKEYKGLVIGISAGSMNLCNTIVNFPEEFEDLNEPRWLEGLGICEDMIIPHFDGKTKTYQFDTEVDLVNQYVLPASLGKKFIGIDNDAYILIDNKGKKSYFGNVCEISNGKVSYERFENEE